MYVSRRWWDTLTQNAINGNVSKKNMRPRYNENQLLFEIKTLVVSPFRFITELNRSHFFITPIERGTARELLNECLHIRRVLLLHIHIYRFFFLVQIENGGFFIIYHLCLDINKHLFVFSFFFFFSSCCFLLCCF